MAHQEDAAVVVSVMTSLEAELAVLEPCMLLLLQSMDDIMVIIIISSVHFQA